MNEIVALKAEHDDFEVEYEVLPVLSLDTDKEMDERQRRIFEGIASIDEMLDENQRILDDLNTNIERLTNNADGLDYVVSVCSGVIAGIFDVLFVEEFSLDNANNIGAKEVEEKIMKAAKKKGYEGDDLGGAVEFLEKKYPIAADKATNQMGGGKQHHLRDFSHHPTIVGLAFSMLTQYTKCVYGTDTAGVFQVVPLSEEDFYLIGKSFPEKVTFGVINWWFHMLSDMAGSSSSIKLGSNGTGLPGPIVSFLKEISALPIFKNLNENGYKEFSVWISKLFNGTLLAERDENGKLVNPIKFDYRTETGIAEILKSQAKPVIINECIVRGFYFISRFFREIKQNEIKSVHDLDKVNWKNTAPVMNRTVERMITISSGTMMAIDLAVAAGQSAIKSGGVGPAFVSNMIVNVNFVGIGRFAIAVGTDAYMGVKNNQLRNQRIVVMNERVFLLNGKTFYKQAGMWKAAEDAGQTINEVYSMMEEAAQFFSESYNDIKKRSKNIDAYLLEAEEKNVGIMKDMKDVLKWG